MNSINTNMPAIQGLTALNSASQEVSVAQNRIATGLKVASPKDDGAAWSIAQNMRADSTALTTVNASLQRAKSAIDVALSAGQKVADILNQMKALALAGTDTSTDSTSRTALVEQYEALRTQIVSTIDGADFDGINLLKSPTNTDFLSSSDGSQKTTIPGQNWNYSPWTPGPVIMLRGYSLDTLTYAGYALSEVDQTIPNVEQSLASLGTSSREIDSSITSNLKLQASLDTGVSNLVDADMGEESAKLQAAQSKQQLAAKALAIANAAPQWILRLFSGGN